VKVAPYEVRGKIPKNGHSPEGTTEFSLDTLAAELTPDKPWANVTYRLTIFRY
jgi:hypothetical protein